MNRPAQIAALDQHFQSQRPTKLDISSTDFQSVQGRFIYSRTPGGLYELYDPETEKIPNIQETIILRLWALDQSFQLDQVVRRLCNGESLAQVAQEIRGLRSQVAATLHDIWRVRLTTSTHMVRTDNLEGEDSVFFYNGSPFTDATSARSAMEGQLSDGGVHYDSEALEVIRKAPEARHMSFSEYLAAKGGNFSGTDFLNHPIFSAAVGDRNLMEDYVLALQALNLLDFYHAGLHSGWRPGEMRSGYGRPIALGYKGEAFYPPNNSTVDHAAIVIPKGTEIQRMNNISPC